MLKKLPVLFLLALVFAGCGGASNSNEPMSPEMAKNMLKLRGFDFDDKGFFNAIKSDDVQAIRAFYDAGINVNARGEKGETPLTYAIQNGETKTIKAVMEKADINQRDALGNSPIHLSLMKNKEDIMDLLLDKGADVNVPGTGTRTKDQPVLYIAVGRGRDDLVQKFLDKGANPNLADADGSTPLSEACVRSDVNTNIVKLLLDKGANPNLAETNGATPLMYISSNQNTDAQTRTEVAKMLLAKNADKKLKDKKGKTALDYAKQIKAAELQDLLK
jgi:ankyrin repeat protein